MQLKHVYRSTSLQMAGRQSTSTNYTSSVPNRRGKMATRRIVWTMGLYVHSNLWRLTGQGDVSGDAGSCPTTHTVRLTTKPTERTARTRCRLVCQQLYGQARPHASCLGFRQPSSEELPRRKNAGNWGLELLRTGSGLRPVNLLAPASEGDRCATFSRFVAQQSFSLCRLVQS